MKRFTCLLIAILAFLSLCVSCGEDDADKNNGGDEVQDGDISNEDGDDSLAEEGDEDVDGDFDEEMDSIQVEDGDEDPEIEMEEAEAEVEIEAEEEPLPDFPLEIGDKVPDFLLPAHDGSDFILSEKLGTRILISAFPAANTSVCTIQTCYVSDHYMDFLSLNTYPVGMSTDGIADLASWADARDYRQLLLSDSDPKGEVSKMFGAYSTIGSVTRRSNIIIDENGYLVFLKLYAMNETPDFAEIMEFLNNN